MENKSVSERYPLGKTLGYRLGQLFCTVLAGCSMALIIALTIKIIIWMF